ncbi:MAG: glutaminyl-peptide cyclotransferase [Anaerolineales bacterium]|nr:glutaminyl-peptide cyclotransferase [Anaerolineales bacterium]
MKLSYFGLATAVLMTFLAACSSPASETPEPTAMAAVADTPVPNPTSEPPTATAVAPCEPFAETAVAPPSSVPTYSYRVLNSYPHDPTAFTQGLLYEDGQLYESTGIKLTPSSLRKVNLTTGERLQFLDVGSDYFAEGLVLWQDKLIQLTWQNHVAFVYDKESFALLNTWEYETEGWGITHNGRCLIMSDGSPTLTFRDPETFAAVGQITVQDPNGPVRLLNELEYVNGEVWANIWQTDRIVRIDPATGQVIGNIDLTGLLDPATLTQPANVLNGIAYDEANGRLFVTGKLWPTLFEIELVPTGDN